MAANSKENDESSKSSQLDLNSVEQMSLSELSALRQKLDGALKVAMNKRKREAQDQIREIAGSLNITVSELLSGMPELADVDKKPKTKLKPQYRSPDRTEEWSGRGRTPRWVLEHVGVEKLDREDTEQVALLEELKIKS